MTHLEGTMEVIGIETELTDIIMSMANDISQLRLAFDASLYLKYPNMSWERLYELKQESWNAYEVMRKEAEEKRVEEAHARRRERIEEINGQGVR